MVESVHGGAKEILPPRALRTLKYKARTVDMTPCFGTFLRDLEDKFGDLVLSGIPDEGWLDRELYSDRRDSGNTPARQKIKHSVLAARTERLSPASPPGTLYPPAVQTPSQLSIMSPLTPQPLLAALPNYTQPPKAGSRPAANPQPSLPKYPAYPHICADGNNEEMPFLPELYDYKFGSKEGFVKTVASAYSHFIVIKALETLAQDRISGPLVSAPAVTTSEFAERCQPTQILDLMWHAHILSPRAYAASGLSLIGTIIDHDPGYYNLNETEHASKLMPKVQKVFKYETRHLLNNYDDAGWVCLVNNSLADFACDINESLHDAGCG